MIHHPRSLTKVHNTKRIDAKQGKLLVDGGCDTTLFGGDFIIWSITNCSVDEQGFANGIKIESLPVVSAVTADELEEEIIIPELH